MNSVLSVALGKEAKKSHWLPGRRWGWLLAAMAPLSLLAALIPELEPVAWMGWGMVAALVVVDGWSLPAPASFTVHRSLPSRLDLGSGDVVEGSVSANSSKVLHLSGVDEAPPLLVEGAETSTFSAWLSPSQPCTWSYPILARERGHHLFGPVSLRWESRYGLVARQASFPLAGQSVAQPDLRPLRRADPLHLPALLRQMGIKPARPRGEGMEFESLRELDPEEGPTRVDWKATARRGRPMTRVFREEQNHDLILAMDCGRLMGTRMEGITKLDHALAAALLLARTSLMRGDRPGMLSFHSQVTGFTRPGSGAIQLRRLIDAGTELTTDWSESSLLRALAWLDQHHRKRSLLIILTDFVQGSDDPLVMESVLRASRRHLPLFIAVRDPHLDRLAHREPRQAGDPFQKAAVQWMIQERAAVMHALRQRGIAALDVDPAGIGAPLINAWMELRGRI